SRAMAVMSACGRCRMAMPRVAGSGSPGSGPQASVGGYRQVMVAGMVSPGGGSGGGGQILFTNVSSRGIRPERLEVVVRGLLHIHILRILCRTPKVLGVGSLLRRVIDTNNRLVNVGVGVRLPRGFI